MNKCPMCGFTEVSENAGKAFQNKFSQYVDKETGNVMGTMMGDKEEVVIVKEDATGKEFKRTFVRADIYASRKANVGTAPSGKVVEAPAAEVVEAPAAEVEPGIKK